MESQITYSAADMSWDDFVARTAFMAKVNSTSQRPFWKGESRPWFEELKLSKVSLEGLNQVFFESDGRLNTRVVVDIDLGDKHGYISFNNGAQRNDKRWQVPIRGHCPCKLLLHVLATYPLNNHI